MCNLLAIENLIIIYTYSRWKNLDKNIEEDERKRLSDDEEGSDDNMEDSQWRKQKIEREKFLEEQRAKV